MIDKHTTTWTWKQDHPRICTYSFLIWFCRMKCCQIWQPVVTLYKGWSACQILYKYFTNTLQGTVSVPNVLITRHRTAGWCPGVERERGLNRFEFLSKGWNQPAGRQRIKEDTERDGFWLQTFKSEQWGQFNGPALRMNACWDLRPSPPLPWQSSSSSLSALWAGLRMNSRWDDGQGHGTIKGGLGGNKAHSLSWTRFPW